MLVNGLDLHVELDGSGPPLVLLHGFTGSLATWDDVRPTLRSSARLVLVDLIGHGRSDASEDWRRYSIEDCVADLETLLDQLDITQADVLGYSMGGRVALHFALAAQRRVRRLVLESASPGIADPGERAQRVAADDALAERIERDGLEAFISFWEQQPLLALAEHVPPKTRERQHQLRLQNRAVGLTNSLRGMGAGRQVPVWDRLRELRCPTLLLAGEHDTRYVGIAERTQQQLPHARRHVIAGAGHTLHVDQPIAFVEAVTAFLGGS